MALFSAPVADALAAATAACRTPSLMFGVSVGEAANVAEFLTVTSAAAEATELEAISEPNSTGMIITVSPVPVSVIALRETSAVMAHCPPLPLRVIARRLIADETETSGVVFVSVAVIFATPAAAAAALICAAPSCPYPDAVTDMLAASAACGVWLVAVANKPLSNTALSNSSEPPTTSKMPLLKTLRSNNVAVVRTAMT